MSMQINFTIYGEPVAQGRPKFITFGRSRNGIYDLKAHREIF